MVDFAFFWDWCLKLVGLLFGQWLKAPDKVAQEAYKTGLETEIADDNQKNLKTTQSELQAVINNQPIDTVDELNKGTF